MQFASFTPRQGLAVVLLVTARFCERTLGCADDSEPPAIGWLATRSTSGRTLNKSTTLKRKPAVLHSPYGRRTLSKIPIVPSQYLVSFSLVQQLLISDEDSEAFRSAKSSHADFLVPTIC